MSSPPEAPRVVSNFDLGIPFALTGAAVWALLYDRVLPSFAFAGVLALGLIGHRASGPEGRRWFWPIVMLCAGTGLLFAWGDGHISLGESVLGGLAFGILLSIPLCFIGIAGRRPWLARAGSLAARAEYRSLWATAILPWDFALALAMFRITDSFATVVHWPFFFVYLVGSKVFFLAADLLLLREMRRRVQEAATWPAVSSPTIHATRRIDLGVGDSTFGLAQPAGYREMPELSAALVGDIGPSLEAVRECIRDYLVHNAVLYGLPVLIVVIAYSRELLADWLLLR